MRDDRWGSMTETLLTAALCFSRMAALFVLVPLPGAKSAVTAPKVILALLTTLLLAPVWLPKRPLELSVPAVMFWLLTELMVGLSIGLGVAFLTESFTLAAQLAGLQAGFSYASTVDPTSQADATVLTVIAQLLASLLFFGAGLDREVILSLATSLETVPPGSVDWGGNREKVLSQVASLGSAAILTALRLVLPVVGLLALVDLSLGLVSRVACQFQLLSASFPLKAALVLLLLAALVPQMPAIFADAIPRARAVWMIWGGR